MPSRDHVPDDPVVVDVDASARVAVITLNRPDQRNALNRAIRTGLPRIITSSTATTTST